MLENKVEMRKRILSKYNERYVVRQIKIKPKLAVDISRVGKPVPRETIRRVLHREWYRSRIARKEISKVNRLKRSEFAKQYVNCPESF